MHVMQPKDVVTFCLLKKQLWEAKVALIINQAMTHQVVGINGEHMLRLLKSPWEVKFCRDKVLAEWKVTGYAPFTR